MLQWRSYALVFAPVLISIFCAFVAFSALSAPALSDAEVRDRIIQESLRGYSGNCPCPYNLMRNGRECGRSSAYSRPGGAAPLCYPNDISDDMVRAYRKRNGF